MSSDLDTERTASSDGAPQRDWTERFDHHDPEFIKDPPSAFKQLRERCPVAHSDLYGGFWVLSRYDDVNHCAQDYEEFTSSVTGVTLIPPTKPREKPWIPIELDPPEHTKYRGLVQHLFTREAIAPLRLPLEKLVGKLLDDAIDKGRCELVRGVAIPVSVGTLGALMDLPAEDHPKWAEWVRRINEGSIHDPEDQARASAEFDEYLGGLIEERRDNPTGDFFSLLLDAELDGEKLTDDEIRGFGVLMLIAGHETTASAMGVMLLMLAERPELLEDIRRRPDVIPSAVNEFLRVITPVQLLARNAARDVELHGCPIPKGDVVGMAFGAANRDPDMFPDPDELVLDRKPNRHLTFGTGRHLCLGAHVARLELEVLLDQLAKRDVTLRLDPHNSHEWRGRGDIRGLARLPVFLDRT